VKPIIYVAAPVTGDPKGNAERVIRWVKWFVDEDPARIYIAPWVAEVLAFLNEPATPAFYQRVLDDDITVVQRLDGLIGVAGRWSGGMLQERVVPLVTNRPLVDMTRFLEPTDVPLSFSLVDEWRRANERLRGTFNLVEPY
jgi:hypothetical protein